MANLNFFNAASRVKKRINHFKIALATLGVAVFLIGISYLALYLWEDKLNKEMQTMQAYLDSDQISVNRQTRQEMESQLSALNTYNNSIDSVVGELQQENIIRSSLVERFNKLVPSEVTLNGLSISSGSISFSGSAPGWSSVVEFSYNLKNDGLFENVDFSSISGVNPSSFSMNCTLADKYTVLNLLIETEEEARAKAEAEAEAAEEGTEAQDTEAEAEAEAQDTEGVV